MIQVSVVPAGRVRCTNRKARVESSPDTAIHMPNLQLQNPLLKEREQSQAFFAYWKQLFDSELSQYIEEPCLEYETNPSQASQDGQENDRSQVCRNGGCHHGRTSRSHGGSSLHLYWSQLSLSGPRGIPSCAPDFQ